MKYLLLMPLLLACNSDKLVNCEPSEEVCDGVDNDCDGVVDQIAVTCENACGRGSSVCHLGTWQECDAPQPTAEVCDGIDNDCDGEIDEASDLPISSCYDGNPETLKYGECRYGLSRCINGAYTCVGSITPQVETCNGKDDDCDGLIDNGGFEGSLDVMFVIDNSSSMGFYSDLKVATRNLLTNMAAANAVRWGVVAAPAMNSVNNRYGTVFPTLVKNLGSALDAAHVIDQQDLASGSGFEPTIDALVDIASENNPLGLDWKGASHIIIVMSDEIPQSYSDPQVSVYDVMPLLGKTRVFIFTAPYNAYTWMPVGPTFALSNPAKLMQNDLEQLIHEGTCK